jgi:copper(I)-binding protein
MNSTPRTTGRTSRLLVAGTLGFALAFALTACAGDPSPAATTAAVAAGQQAAALTITDPWVKAADSGMTAAFGTLTNDGDTDVRIVSASTPVASSVELHEMATNDAGQMVMRPKEGGFDIPAGGTHQLAPGGDHLMLMNVTTAVKPGDLVTVTLTAEDGSTVDFTAPARSFSGGNEAYAGNSATPTPTPARS